jgi:hypothetical protein
LKIKKWTFHETLIEFILEAENCQVNVAVNEDSQTAIVRDTLEDCITIIQESEQGVVSVTCIDSESIDALRKALR